MAVTKEDMLLEEWKQNVALYIDQDKRGLERTKIFLTVQAGLFVLYGIIFTSSLNRWFVIVATLLVAGVAIYLTVISYFMSKRAHAYIRLRKLQALLIEEKLNKIVDAEAVTTADGAITTFTRESVSFHGKELSQEDFGNNTATWQLLVDELVSLGSYMSNPLVISKRDKGSMGHFIWLKRLHWTLVVFWILSAFLITLCSLLRPVIVAK